MSKKRSDAPSATADGSVKRKAKKRVKLPPFDQKRPDAVRPKEHGYAAYVVCLRDYYAARREWAKSCIALETHVPLEEKNQSALLRKCWARNITESGNKATLVERIRAFDRGDIVDKRFAEPTLPTLSPSSFHIVAPLTVKSGKASLLALSHDVIRAHLVPYLDNASAVCFAQTCKYVCGDALFTLQARAKAMFGANATPLALSCHDHLVDLALATKRRRTVGKNTLLGPLCLSHQVMDDLEREPKECIARLIRLSLEKYGSMEAVVAERKLRDKRSAAATEKKEALRAGAPGRLQQVNDYLVAAGLAPLFYLVESRFVQVEAYYAAVAEVAFVGGLRAFSSAIDRVSDYVLTNYTNSSQYGRFGLPEVAANAAALYAALYARLSSAASAVAVPPAENVGSVPT